MAMTCVSVTMARVSYVPTTCGSALMKCLHRFLLASLITLFVSAYAGSAWAVPPTVPSAQPEQVGKSLTLPEARPEVSKTPLITVPGTGGHGTTLKDNTTFVLKAVKVEGNTV